MTDCKTASLEVFLFIMFLVAIVALFDAGRTLQITRCYLEAERAGYIEGKIVGGFWSDACYGRINETDWRYVGDV